MRALVSTLFSGARALSDVLPVTATSVSADDLVAELARGNPSALRAAYRDHHAYVRTFARRLTGDDGAAEDLVQDVFVALPQAARRFRGEASLRSFLVAIAINGARRHVRAAARRRTAQRRVSAEAPRQAPTLASDPHQAAERRQLAQALSAALDTLPLDQRIAFVLCEVEERSSAEAAALVGTSDGTMRARVFHAKKKLRAALASWHAGGQRP